MNQFDLQTIMIKILLYIYIKNYDYQNLQTNDADNTAKKKKIRPNFG